MPLPAIQPLPEGVVLRPLQEGSWPCTAVAFFADRPLVLRETVEAVVYAGALADAAGGIVQWLEIWVQRIAASPLFHLSETAPDASARDARWRELHQCFAGSGDGRMLHTGIEKAPGAVFRWNAAGERLSPESGESPALSFNPEGGLIFLRYAAPHSAGEYAAALSSGQLPPAGPRFSPLVIQKLQDVRHTPGYYLRSWQGNIPPLAEILHLKLSLIHGMMQAVESALRSRRQPLLNLKTRSFGLEWAGERSGLALWTVQPVLDMSSAATRWLGGSESDDPVFLLTEEPPASIYRHPAVSAPRFVKGKVRLSQVRAVGSQKDQIEAEGTLLITESLPHPTDSLLIRCPFAAGPLQCCITSLEPARGEIVFRTTRWKPAPEFAASLAGGGQAPPPMDGDCALVPRLSAPADLYSLGIIALEILCCGSGQGLPMVVDEALRLAQRLGQEQVSVDAMPDTIAAWQRREAKENWADVLSARHLAAPALEADAVVRHVPQAAWLSALAWTLRMLTGSSNQAYFRYPGEGSTHAPHQALEAPLRDLRNLLHRTRSLVTLEWKANLDLREQIMAVMDKG